MARKAENVAYCQLACHDRVHCRRESASCGSVDQVLDRGSRPTKFPQSLKSATGLTELLTIVQQRVSKKLVTLKLGSPSWHMPHTLSR